MTNELLQDLTAKLLVMQRIEDAYALIESISTEQFSNGSRETILAVIADELKYQVGKVEEFGDKIQAKIAEKTYAPLITSRADWARYFSDKKDL